jgi:hypothetical protein
LYFALLEQRELFTKEEILGGQSCARPEAQSQEAAQVSQDCAAGRSRVGKCHD